MAGSRLSVTARRRRDLSRHFEEEVAMEAESSEEVAATGAESSEVPQGGRSRVRREMIACPGARPSFLSVWAWCPSLDEASS